MFFIRRIMNSSTVPKNNAAWIDRPGHAVRVGVHDLRSPGPGEVLVKNRAVAINPFDCLQQSTGEFVDKWPCIFGHDLSGEIVSVGEEVTGLVVGQRVLAQALHRSLEDTAFQEHSIVQADVTCPIPDGISFESACVIPLALATAAAGLYQKGYLELPLPKVSPAALGETLLVWGGSSSVGSAAIQLAVASGLGVVTTASTGNFEYCRKLGAKEVFDYNSATIVEDLVDALGRNGKIAGAFTGSCLHGTKSKEYRTDFQKPSANRARSFRLSQRYYQD